MEIDIPQHVLFNEESKVTWSYQKGKYYQQVDSPSTYTQDRSGICTQKGLKIWYRPERKHQIRSRGSPVPKLHICEATHPIRERPSKDPTTKQPSTKFWIWETSRRIGRSFLPHLWPFPPPNGTCGTSSSSSVGNDRKEGIWSLMANLKAAPRSLTTTPSSEACLWLIDWLVA